RVLFRFITRFRQPFEAVVCTVLGQQVSLAAGRLFAARLVAAYGTLPRGDERGPTGTDATGGTAEPAGETAEPTEESAGPTRSGAGPTGAGEAAPLRAFPVPSALAAVPPAELRATIGLTGSRARTVHEAAVLCADQGGGAMLPPRDALQAVHGIGAWTLDHLALRAGTDADAYPVGDAVLRRTLAALDPWVGPARIASWSPYRGYAATRLWAFGRWHGADGEIAAGPVPGSGARFMRRARRSARPRSRRRRSGVPGAPATRCAEGAVSRRRGRWAPWRRGGSARRPARSRSPRARSAARDPGRSPTDGWCRAAGPRPPDADGTGWPARPAPGRAGRSRWSAPDAAAGRSRGAPARRRGCAARADPPRGRTADRG